jgi:hypothetical protein
MRFILIFKISEIIYHFRPICLHIINTKNDYFISQINLFQSAKGFDKYQRYKYMFYFIALPEETDAI